MHLNSKQSVAKGASAELFKIQPNRVVKLYKSHIHPDFQGTQYGAMSQKAHSDLILNSFHSEKTVYTILSKNQKIIDFFPKFYGAKTIDSVNENGVDISDHFELECCFEIELVIAEHELKLGDIYTGLKFGVPLDNHLLEFTINNNFDLLEFRKELENIGWDYFVDSSVLFNECTFKVFDFEKK